MVHQTGLEVEAYIHGLVARELAGAVDGVFRRGARPAHRDGKVDAVVGFLSGRDESDGFHQGGVVVLNIYVPDLPSMNGSRLRDVTRLTKLSRRVLEMIRGHPVGCYHLRADGLAEVFSDEGAGIHYLSQRIRYRYNAVETSEDYDEVSD